MAMTKYDICFTQLSRYAPNLRQTAESDHGYVRQVETTLLKTTKTKKNANGDKGKGVTSSSHGRSTQPTNKSKGQTHVFALTQQDAKAFNVVVTSTLPICGTEALVLFDPGSTHSFMSPYFVPKLNRFFSNIEEPLIVTIPLEETFVAEYVYKSYVVRIKDNDTLTDLVLLLTLDFDVILGMD
ncbi:uncharacterized protein LOC110427017 [Herrania umbratica]|uniref:Uncharacterized protein LOC110427017 n=1 Tax=Herrania umbratica TaxID=108875 RepID=A0A6J1BG01_9ROSI|nr:uncharacterized protein LOC110427017 [Herrania umbratica]